MEEGEDEPKAGKGFNPRCEDKVTEKMEREKDFDMN